MVHDGRPAAGATRFSKRNLHLSRPFCSTGRCGAAVDRTNVHDPVLRAALPSLHDAHLAVEDPLDGEVRNYTSGNGVREATACREVLAESEEQRHLIGALDGVLRRLGGVTLA